ncbi:tripartite tricarboxylate transporter substrate binding protein [Cloacibacillus sp.]
MKRSALVSALAALFIAAFVFTAAAADYPSRPFEFLAPAGAGGGWDTTIRMVGKTLGDLKIITQPMPVTNKPGGGGAVNLAYMQKKKGNPYTITVYSPPILLINLTGQTKLGYKNLTPIAMLINDFGAYAVPKDSKFNSMKEVIEAIKKDPKSVKVGGTSSAGSMDHLQFLQAARAAGVKNLKEIPYISLQEGSMASLMGGHIDLLSTGMAETVGALEAGDIKVLAVSSPTRIKSGPLSKVPTLKESGIDTVFINWRGIFGTPGMGKAERDYMTNALKKMSESKEWKDVCLKNGWEAVYMNADEFTKFLDKTNEEYKVILGEIGFLKQ